MDACSVERIGILQVVLRAIEAANSSRDGQSQLEVSPDAPLFGAASPLDSLGLVALLIDIEEAFADRGHPVVLSDERALSQRRSPFRNVASLVEYIERLLTEEKG
jgi:acyl carrier protein